MHDTDLCGSSLPRKLQISHTVGTSARSHNHVSQVDNLLAYSASGGVVVSQLDRVTGAVLTQRFFCANTSSSGSNSFPTTSEEQESRKDDYGFPITNEPITAGSGLADGSPSKSAFSEIEATTNASPSKLKDRVRSISCIALSPNKRVLAVGESGYQPRILLFSLASNLTGGPFAQVYEHSFGINSITFMQDLRHFCSLGLVNDGFLNVWRYSSTAVTLLAGNRCSSVINQVIAHENYIITLGLRLVKVWNFSEETIINKVLKGKNVLLGPLLNLNFTAGAVLNNDELLVTANNSNLLLLKVNYDALKLVPLQFSGANLGTMAIDYDLDTIWFASKDGIDSMKTFELDVTENAPSDTTDWNSGILKIYDYNDSNLLYLTLSEEIILYDKESAKTTKIVYSLINRLAGIKETFLNELLVFSHDGLIKKIQKPLVDKKLQLTLPNVEVVQNSLTAIDCAKEVFVGDKHGNLSVLDVRDPESYDIVYSLKAHSSTINDVIYFEIDNHQFLSSISRDRMIQVYHQTNGVWDILQTLPTHTGNLLKIMYHNKRIYVCSSDRTLSVHKFEVDESTKETKILQEKILSFKNSPLNMKIFENDLIVATNDRTIMIYNIAENYEFSRALKLFNEKTNESLLVENFLVYDNLIVVSSSDKSLRLFLYASGRPVGVSWGHLDSILSLTLQDKQLLTISADACLFTWQVLQEEIKGVSRSPSLESTEFFLPTAKVTRKILPAAVMIPSPTKKTEASPEEPPSSPSPRLSNATLKRMEAKRKLQEAPGIVSNGSLRSSRPSSPVRGAPPRIGSPVRNSPAPSSPVRLTSPVKLGSPSRTSTVNKRSLIDFLMLPSASLSPGRPLRANDFMEKSISYLTIIKSQLAKETLAAEDLRKLRQEVVELLLVLDGDGLSDQLNALSLNDESLVLEKYSDRLVQIFEQKWEQREKATRTS